jgi:hypothetical protein
VLPVLARTDRVVTTKVDVVMGLRTVGKEIARMDVSICGNIPQYLERFADHRPPGNATALCGRDSLNGDVSCPLNVCCSYYGYCGVSRSE